MEVAAYTMEHVDHEVNSVPLLQTAINKQCHSHNMTFV